MPGRWILLLLLLLILFSILILILLLLLFLPAPQCPSPEMLGAPRRFTEWHANLADCGFGLQ